MVFKCFDKRARQTQTRISENQELATELHKPITRNFKNVNYAYLINKTSCRHAFTKQIQ